MRARLGRIAAWVVTAAALGWLFWKTPIGQVIAALRQAAPWTRSVFSNLFSRNMASSPDSARPRLR